MRKREKAALANPQTYPSLETAASARSLLLLMSTAALEHTPMLDLCVGRKAEDASTALPRHDVLE